MKSLIGCFFIVFTLNTFAQDLLGERIRKIDGHKRSIYMEKGIFHNGAVKVASQLKAIRHAYNKQEKCERLVIDFTTAQIPRIYGHLAAEEKKLYIDFFDTELEKNVGSFGKSQSIQNINFFPTNKEVLSLEVAFKGKVSSDVFYLESPGRLVVDIR
jgi:hypothetical protein